MSLVAENGEQKRKDSESATEEPEVDPQFEPVVNLPEIEVTTNEENEEELVKLRAKLFRFDISVPKHPEWKERGTGEVKLLRHKENNSVRVVMRRDKTLKICANHFVTPWMELKPSAGSSRAWVWTVLADFADETAKQECLAIRFSTPEIAAQWKTKFDEARKIVKEQCILYKKEDETLDDSSGSEKEADESTSDKLNSEDKNEKDADESTPEKLNSGDKNEKEANENTPEKLDSGDKKELEKDDENVIKKMAEMNVSK